MMTIIFYAAVFFLILWSAHKSMSKTKQALLKSWNSFENMLPLFLAIVFIVDIILSFLTPETIALLLGGDSNWYSIVLAAIIGSCTIIPGFVTFPLAHTLLENGAGFFQITVFISTSVMVGVLTMPIEIQYFGKKAAYIRNMSAIFFSFLIACIMEALLK